MFVGPRGRNEKSVRVTQGIHRAGNVCKCLVHGWRSFDFLFCCFEAGIDIQPFVLFVVVILFYVVANSVQHFFRHATIFTTQGLILSQRYPPGRKKKNEQYSAALAYASQSVVGSHLRHIVARPRSTALRFLFFPFEEQNQTPRPRRDPEGPRFLQRPKSLAEGISRAVLRVGPRPGLSPAPPRPAQLGYSA